jgi:hypothetical protein
VKSKKRELVRPKAAMAAWHDGIGGHMRRGLFGLWHLETPDQAVCSERFRSATRALSLYVEITARKRYPIYSTGAYKHTL